MGTVATISPETRLLEKFQREVLDALDDDFIREMGTKVTSQFVEVIQGVFVPNRSLGSYRLSGSQALSEGVPVFFDETGATKFNLSSNVSKPTLGQIDRVEDALKSAKYYDVGPITKKEVMTEILFPDFSPWQEIYLKSRKPEIRRLGQCDAAVNSFSISSNEYLNVCGRPSIILLGMNNAGVGAPVFGHEVEHARQVLYTPIRRHRDESDEDISALIDELMAYTTES